eukprot:jgi/Chrzof1/8926/Cz03g29120.t1
MAMFSNCSSALKSAGCAAHKTVQGIKMLQPFRAAAQHTAKCSTSSHGCQQIRHLLSRHSVLMHNNSQTTSAPADTLANSSAAGNAPAATASPTVMPAAALPTMPAPEIISSSIMVESAAALENEHRLQEYLDKLEKQMASQQPPDVYRHTLVKIIELAAANAVPIHCIASTKTLQCFIEALKAPLAVAALSAEVLCRVVCQGLTDYQAPLHDVITPLLDIIEAHPLPSAEAVSAVFFSVSTLVRLSSTPALASAILSTGRLAVVVDALNVAPSSICQVTTFILYKLQRASELEGGSADLLLQLAKQGGFPKLCNVLQHVEGSAAELAFTLLLEMASTKEVQQALADKGELRHIVQVLSSAINDRVRMHAVLILARLANKNTACQLDIIREGAAPILVDMIVTGNDDDKSHAARLLAILGQHPSTHESIRLSGALQAVMALIRLTCKPLAGRTAGSRSADISNNSSSTWDHSSVPSSPQLPSTSTNWHTSRTAGSSTYPPGSDGSEGRACDHFGLAIAAKGRAEAAGCAAANGAATTISPSAAAAVEQALSVCCMLAHNPDNHFFMVGSGLIPVLIPLLAENIPAKTQTYALATLLMIAMAEGRHAAVVARAQAVPALTTLAREAPNWGNREFAGALLACLARSQDIQIDIVAAGGIPALVRLIAEGTAEARCHAAEALLQIASTSDARCKLVVRTGALQPIGAMLSAQEPVVKMWGAHLLATLAQEPSVCEELCYSHDVILQVQSLLTASVPANFEVNSMAMSSDQIHLEVSQDGLELNKARTHAAWLLARLASNHQHRQFVCSIGVIPALVVMLRQAQQQEADGFTLTQVLEGFHNNMQAAASAALLALSHAHEANSTAVLHELSVQLWMGHDVKLEGVWLGL